MNAKWNVNPRPPADPFAAALLPALVARAAAVKPWVEYRVPLYAPAPVAVKPWVEYRVPVR